MKHGLIGKKLFKVEFRYPKPRQRLTTVIAVQCKDGIVFCAEGQESDDEVKENIIKIRPVGYDDKTDKYSMIGCSGASDYINLFEQYVGKAVISRGSTSYFDALDKSICDYEKYISTRSDASGGLMSFEGYEYPKGIFVGHDIMTKRDYVYALNPPRPPRELRTPYRVIIGTGKRFTLSLFGVAEELMYWIDFDWSKLSTKLVSRFCCLVLGLVTTKDTKSGMGTTFYVINEMGCTLLSDGKIFPGIEKRDTFRLPMLLEALLDEVPKDKLLKLARMYDPNKVLLTKLLALVQ